MASFPSRKHFSDIKHLPSYNDKLPILADLLTSLCAKNDRSGKEHKKTVFDGRRTASVSVKDYLIRMCKYGYCSPTVFICMAVYIDRLCDRTDIELTSSNIHRILLAAFLISAKLNDDVYYSNKYYANIGGIDLKETNEIEAVFLEKTDWQMYVSGEEFRSYVADLRAPTSGPPPSGTAGAASLPATSPSSNSPAGSTATKSSHAAGTPAYALRAQKRASAEGMVPKTSKQPAARRPSLPDVSPSPDNFSRTRRASDARSASLAADKLHQRSSVRHVGEVSVPSSSATTTAAITATTPSSARKYIKTLSNLRPEVHPDTEDLGETRPVKA